MMGGGDVKLLTVLALWVPPYDFLQLLVIMAIVTTFMASPLFDLVYGRRHKTEGEAEPVTDEPAPVP